MLRTAFSPSNLARRVACPGSLKMEEGLPESDSPEASEGTELHRLIADPKLSRDHLDSEQLQTLEATEQMEQQFFDSLIPAANVTDLREEESNFVIGHRTLFRGHLDHLVVTDKWLAVVDFKFGRNAAPSSEMNWQLKSYLGIVAPGFKPVEKYFGAIIQPRVSRKVQPVVYTSAQVEAARKEIKAAWDACQKPDAPRVASHDACCYCRAFLQGICPEGKAFALQSTKRLDLIRNPSEVLRAMLPENRTSLFDSFSLAVKLHDIYKKAVKEIVEQEPDFVPGYILSPGGSREAVTDMGTLFGRLAELGATANGFIDISTVSKKKLETFVKELTKLKGQALADKLKELLDGVVDKTPVSPSFERK